MAKENPIRVMSEAEKYRLTAICSHVFSPSAPVDKLSLFAGRLGQLRQLSQAIHTRGRHSVLFGERGVGKTSLTNILKDALNDMQGMRIVRINCEKRDTFRSVWLKMLSEITVIVETQDETTAKSQRVEHTLDNYVHEVEQLGSGELRRILQRWSQPSFEMVLIFDEFNELPECERESFADTIKDLSDHSVHSTIVLVGVADNVDSLLEEHASVDRCIEQIKMPTMSDPELAKILSTAMQALKMDIAPDASRLIVALSQGFPHYTHLIGQESTYEAIKESSFTVEIKHVHGGIISALNKVQQSIITAYHKAVSGQRRGTLFPKVLLACALAGVDEVGCFSPADVRGPLCRITKEDYDIPSFSQHLDKFSTDEARGPVLEKSGAPRRYRFKFHNPLLRPFIIMRGFTDNMITGDLISELRPGKPIGPLFSGQ